MKESIAMVEQIYASFAAGDLDAVMQHCAADIVVTQDPELPWGGRYVGRDGVAEFALRLIGAIDSNVVAEGMFEAGDCVVQRGRTSGTVRASGVAFDIAECHIWKVVDGLVSEAAFFIDSPAMLSVLGR